MESVTGIREAQTLSLYHGSTDGAPGAGETVMGCRLMLLGWMA